VYQNVVEWCFGLTEPHGNLYNKTTVFRVDIDDTVVATTYLQGKLKDEGVVAVP
jgi:hypothetical protein